MAKWRRECSQFRLPRFIQASFARLLLKPSSSLDPHRTTRSAWQSTTEGWLRKPREVLEAGRTKNPLAQEEGFLKETIKSQKYEVELKINWYMLENLIESRLLRSKQHVLTIVHGRQKEPRQKLKWKFPNIEKS